MSLKSNIIANYASQIYVTAVGIAIVPFYIEYMGAEAYGLVAFYLMLQAMFNLLDMGLTPTMAREAARYNGGAIKHSEYRNLVRALEGVFFFIAILGGGGVFLLSNLIAERWLNITEISAGEVIRSLQIIAAIIALRWMCGLYRGVISGSERQVWLSAFNSAIATGRFVLVIPALFLISPIPTVFFSYQLLVALIEIGGLVWMTYQLLPRLPIGEHITLKWAPLKPVLKFSLSIAFTSSVWVFVTQTDKLVLSKILSLSDYGYFAVAVMVAGGIAIMSGPIGAAIMPRMSKLQAEGKDDKSILLYRKATQFVVVVTMPVALVLIFFPNQVLWAWTENGDLVEKVSVILKLYAAGYVSLAIAAFPFFLQYAKGNLRLHVVGNFITLVTLVPSIIWSAYEYGMVGPAWSWFIGNTLYMLIWVPVVHYQVLPGLHCSWLLRDVISPSILPLCGMVLIYTYTSWTDSRIENTLMLIAIAVTLFLLGFPMADKLKLNKLISIRR